MIYVETAKFTGELVGGAVASATAVLIVGSIGGGAIVVIALAAYFGGKYTGDITKDIVANKVGIC